MAGMRGGLPIRAQDVVIGAGAKPFIAYAILSTTDHGAGDEVIYPNPGFPIYESQIIACGAKPVPVQLREARDFAFDPAELEKLITPKTKLIFMNHITSSTGLRFPVEEVIAYAKSKGIMIFIDGAHVPGQIPLDPAGRLNVDEPVTLRMQFAHQCRHNRD